MTREQVYGRRPVREALRGGRAVLELWATERALAAEPWLRENGKRVHVKQERELSEAADTRDHQGVLAWVEPYKYADAHELADAPRPLIVALDQVSDPHNLGAVIRTAEAAGATGVVVPAHGSARVTPAVARASAGAVEHLPVAVVTNLARYLGEVKSGDLWVVGAAGDAPRSMWEADLSGGLALVFGAEGKGLRPLVRRTCDELVSIPLEGSVESLNVSVAAGVLVYEAKPPTCLTRPLYLFDGWNLLHAGSFKEPTELIDRLASFVGMTGARGILVFDGTGPDERIGPLEIRFAEHADTLLERLAAEHRGPSRSASSRRTA